MVHPNPCGRKYTDAEKSAARRLGFPTDHGPLIYATGPWFPSEFKRLAKKRAREAEDYEMLAAAVDREWLKPIPPPSTRGESEWRCYQCGSTRWGPWGDRAKCHFCGVVSDVPTPTTPSTETTKGDVTMPDAERVIICGADSRLSERAECPHPLHSWPLPAGYGDATASAISRLNRGWSNRRCQVCGLYGWVRGKRTTADIFVPPPTPPAETNGEQR